MLQLNKTNKKNWPEAAFWTRKLGNKVRSLERTRILQPFRAQFWVSNVAILNQWRQREQNTKVVEQCIVVIYSKLKHGEGSSYRSCGMKSNYLTASKLNFTEPNQLKISFGTICSICCVIRHFTTTRKSCPKKLPVGS